MLVDLLLSLDPFLLNFSVSTGVAVSYAEALNCSYLHDLQDEKEAAEKFESAKPETSKLSVDTKSD